MAVINADELVSYLREPGTTSADVALVVELANGLIADEITGAEPDPWPTWVKILALSIAEAGWVKFNEERVDDWSGTRSAALAAMALSDGDLRRLARLDGQATSTGAATLSLAGPDAP